MAKAQSVDSPALEVAREKAAPQDDIITLSTGIRARIRPVAASLLDTVRMRVPMPDVPVWHNPDKGRDEPNPSDPEYARQVDDVNRQRNLAVGDASIMFGVELVDPVPDSGWEKRLALLGIVVDGQDELEREFAFKKYIAVAAPDLRQVLAKCAGISTEQLEQAAEFFRRNPERGADTES